MYHDPFAYYDRRIQELENRLARPTYTPQQQPETVQPTYATPFIEVRAEDEARKHKLDGEYINSGRKQYFYNIVTDEYYVKWFDANEAETFFHTYVLKSETLPDVPGDAPQRNFGNEIDILRQDIETLRGLLTDGRHVMELDETEHTASGGGSTSSGKRGKQARDHNGRFRAACPEMGQE